MKTVMKKLIALAILGFAAMFATPVKAQVSVNINIGAQPDWGPRGYDYVNYYYLPEVESYYYVPTRKFIYLDRGRWIHARTLPHRYRGYNLHGGRKVVINDNRPYLNHKHYRTRYASNNYYAKPNRVVYRDYKHSKNYSRNGKSDAKYYKKSRQTYQRSDGGKHDRKDNRGNHGRGRDHGRH